MAQNKYSIDDPVDIVRYWLEESWSKANVNPKPQIANMFSKPSVRIPTKYGSAVRPYCTTMTPEREDWYGDFVFFNWHITVDIRAGNEPTAKLATKEVVRILKSKAGSLNPNSEGIYTWLVVKKVGNLTETRNLIFHKVVEVDLHSRFQDAQLQNLGFNDITLKVSVTA